jgi:hypothetical protein
MATQTSLIRRWGDFKASKTVLFWSCAACIVATLIIGFNWGGWVTGGTAASMAAKSAAGARAELAAAVCVDRFVHGPNMTADFASLKGSSSWQRGDLIEKGGWATMAGAETPVSGAAELCAQQLLEWKPPATAAAGTTG